MLRIVNKTFLQETEFIHYWNTDQFDVNKFRNIENSYMSKPHWWIWWSPVNSNFWWVDFVNKEFEKPINGWLHNSFLFKINPNAKILYIDNEEGIYSIYNKYKINWWYSLDYEKIAKKYDWIYMSAYWNSSSHEMDDVTPLSFYDCECIIAFYWDIIIPEVIIEINV